MAELPRQSYGPGLVGFIAQSNLIEGIERPVEGREVAAHRSLLGLHEVTVADLEVFVRAVAGPSQRLRDRQGLDVRVGLHVPPPGGPAIRSQLAGLLAGIALSDLTPYQAHVEYETLHPFTDGNGRSGRALWAWQMLQWRRDPFAFPLGFLQRWYYESLDAGREAPGC